MDDSVEELRSGDVEHNHKEIPGQVRQRQSEEGEAHPQSVGEQAPTHPHPADPQLSHLQREGGNGQGSVVSVSASKPSEMVQHSEKIGRTSHDKNDTQEKTPRSQQHKQDNEKKHTNDEKGSLHPSNYQQYLEAAEQRGQEAGREEALASLRDMLLSTMDAARERIATSQATVSEKRTLDALGGRFALGQHAGLAGRHSFARPVGGGRGGGPGAGPNVQGGQDPASASMYEGQAKPSFKGPNRFPGGMELMPEGQPSVGGQASANNQRGLNLQHSINNTVPMNSIRSESYFGSNANVSFVDKAEVEATRNMLSRIRFKFKEFFAEFIACVLLLLVGASVDAQVQLSQRLTPADQAGSYPSQNWAWGLAVMCTIHLAGGISGAHCNPGITIGLAVFRGFPWRMVWIYLLAQYLGCFCGAGLAYSIYQPAIDLYEGQGIRTIVGQHSTGNFFTTVPSATSTSASALGTELCASSILGAMILAIGDDSNSPPGDGMSALIIGLTVTMVGMSLGWNSGYPINPARDLGPRIFLSIAGYEKALWTHNNYWWIYGGQAATYLGTLSGCFLYDLLLHHGRHSPLNSLVHWRWQKTQRRAVNVLAPLFTSNARRGSKGESETDSSEKLEEQTGSESQLPTEASTARDEIKRAWACDT